MTGTAMLPALLIPAQSKGSTADVGPLDNDDYQCDDCYSPAPKRARIPVAIAEPDAQQALDAVQSLKNHALSMNANMEVKKVIDAAHTTATNYIRSTMQQPGAERPRA